MPDHSLDKEIAALKADVASLREDIKKPGKAVVGATDEKIKVAKESLDEHAKASKDEIERKLGEAFEQGQKTLNRLDDEVREHPVGSLVTAFVLGLVIARILDTGRKH